MGTVAVVGLGKIGLPLAVHFARAGQRVLGCDVNAAHIDAINAGINRIEGEAGLDEGVAETVAAGLLAATADTTAAVAEADVVVVVVPLIALDGGQLDFSVLDAANAAIAPGLHPGVTVVYETTLPMGTTRRFAATLAEASGLTLGVDLFVAFSPERVYSGRIFADLATYPKIVGGVDDASGARAAAFYASVLAPRTTAGDEMVRLVPSSEAAELVKLAETTYRDINIAFANELARYAAGRGVDVDDVITLANTQPFSHIHRPGAGVGGHCIPHYPRFILWDDADAPLISLARTLNDGQPGRLMDTLSETLGGLAGKRILILGVSYREDVKERTSSPGIDIIGLVAKAGGEPFGHDPYFTDDEIRAEGAEPAPLDALGSFDAIVLQAAHAEYRAIDWGASLTPGQVVLDGRNALDPAVIAAAGVTYLGVGRVTRAPR